MLTKRDVGYMTTADIGFVDREEYLDVLTERYDRDQADLIIISDRQRLGKSELVPYTYRGVGYWWHRQHELDVVGPTDEGVLVVGECKYTTREMTEGDLASVEDAAPHIDWTPPGGGSPEYEYCCCCRSGFSDDLTATAAARDDVHLFTTADIVTALTTDTEGTLR